MIFIKFLNNIFNILFKYNKLRHRHFLLIIFSASILIRLLFLVFFWGVNTPVVDDGQDYQRIAVNLVQTGSFIGKTGITGRRAPLYPFFISLIYLLFGINPAIVRIIQCFLGALMVLLVYKLAEEFYGEKVALISAILSSFYPVFVFLPSRILTENLFAFITLLSIFYLARNQNNSNIHFIISGLLIGLAVLTRPALLLIPPFLFLWLRNISISQFNLIKKTLLIILGMTVIITPWSVRNYILFKQIVPVTTNSGITFMHDNNSYLSKMGWAGPQNRIFRPEVVYPELLKNKDWYKMNEAQQDKFLMNKTWQWIFNHPLTFFSLLPRKLISFFNFKQSSNTIEIKQVIMNLVSFLSYGLLLPLMAIGFGWTWKNCNKQQRLIHYVIFTFLAGVILYAGSVRLRVPIEPYLLIFASFTLVRFYEIFEDRDS